MTDNNVFNMAEPSSLVADGIPFHTNFIPLSSHELIVLNNRNQSMSGFPGPSALHRDNNLEACNDGTISDSYPTGYVQPERFSIGDFLCGALYPLNNAEVKGRYMEGMPLSATSLSNLLAARCNPHETLNKFASSTPFAYPLEVHRNVNPTDGSNTLIDNVPDSTSTKWDTSNFVTHPEPAEKDIGRTGLQPFGLMQNINPEGWVASQSTSLSSDGPGSSRLSNELSLSLATSDPSVLCRNFIQDHCSEICGSDSSPYERCLTSGKTSCSRNLSLCFDSSKPIQLSQFLSGSVYVNAIQEILAEVAFYSHGNPGHMNYLASGIEDQADVSFSSSCTAGEGYLGSASVDFSDSANKAPGPMMQQREIGRKKKHLLALLQVVDDQYSQCLDEIHTVVSAFHAVTELNPDIHARFALQTISFLYKSLRERISNHILKLGVHFGDEVARKEENSFETSFIQKQWALQQLRRKDNQIWRPQRGLPERSVSVLRAWMFQNFLHPYPKDAEKHLLAVKSGLTRSQVSNWFINARVRLWKPMIEEMYSEMNRRKSRR